MTLHDRLLPIIAPLAFGTTTRAEAWRLVADLLAARLDTGQALTQAAEIYKLRGKPLTASILMELRAAIPRGAFIETAARLADHLVLLFPLWMGDMPALTKGFIEQVARPGFAVGPEGARPFGHKPLSGRSARVVVTMGMPALVYRWFYRAHSLKALERNVLGFIGYGPIHETLIGQVEALGEAGAATWLKRLRRLGRRGD